MPPTLLLILHAQTHGFSVQPKNIKKSENFSRWVFGECLNGKTLPSKCARECVSQLGKERRKGKKEEGEEKRNRTSEEAEAENKGGKIKNTKRKEKKKKNEILVSAFSL